MYWFNEAHEINNSDTSDRDRHGSSGGSCGIPAVKFSNSASWLPSGITGWVNRRAEAIRRV